MKKLVFQSYIKYMRTFYSEATIQYMSQNKSLGLGVVMHLVQQCQTCYLFVFIFALIDIFSDVSFQSGDRL